MFTETMTFLILLFGLALFIFIELYEIEEMRLRNEKLKDDVSFLKWKIEYMELRKKDE